MDFLTAKQIRAITFTSGRGYKDEDVDDFVDRCADTVEMLQNKIDELNKKMEVLADKLVEYRNEEDSIRSALLSAQRLGDSIVREAKQKSELMLEDAQIKATKVVETAQREIVDEQMELARVQQEVADFKSRMLVMYRQHLSLIDLLPEPETKEEPVEVEEEKEEAKATAEAEKADVEEPVCTDKPIVTEFVEMPDDFDFGPVSEEDVIAEEERYRLLDEAEAAKEALEELPESDDDNDNEVNNDTNEEVPSSRFGELKFGKEYTVNSAFKKRK